MIEVVYFLERDEAIKIGYTKDLRARRSGLGGRYRGAIPGGREVEKTLLKQFAAFRIKGEWFSLDPVLLETADRLISERGVVGEECVSLTDPEAVQRDAIKVRDREIANRASAALEEYINKRSARTGALKMSVLYALADKIGAPRGRVFELRYRPPAMLTSAFADALFAEIAKEMGTISVAAGYEDLQRQKYRAERAAFEPSTALGKILVRAADLVGGEETGPID